MIKTKHLFKLSAMVDKMGLDEELKLLLGKDKKKMSNQDLGQTIIMAIVKKMHRAEKETIELLASVTGKTKKEIEDLPIKDLIELFNSILSEDGVLDFLSKQPEG